MQIHLRLGVKDADIIYWKNYLPKSCFCMYVKEILTAEKMKKIAVVPVPVKPGFDRQNVDYKLIIQDKPLIQFVKSFPKWKRSPMIKQIIKKHLKANYGNFQSEEPVDEKEKAVQTTPVTQEIDAVRETEFSAVENKAVADEPLTVDADIPQEADFDDDDDDDMSEEYKRMLREMSGN